MRNKKYERMIIMKKLKKLSYASALNIASLGLATQAFALDVESPGFPEGVGMILGIIQTIGILIAVGTVMYVGIKYLTSGAGKKAEAKETMVPVLIGAVLLALAIPVIRWIFGAFDTNIEGL